MVSIHLFYTDKYRLNKIIKIKNISGWINKLFEIIKAQPSYVFNTCPFDKSFSQNLWTSSTVLCQKQVKFSTLLLYFIYNNMCINNSCWIYMKLQKIFTF